MRRTAPLTAAIALVTAGLAIVLAPAASAAGAGPTPIAEVQIPVRVSGDLVVQFHGDAAAGCAASGVCGYSGAVSWDPAGQGSLFVLESRQHGRISYSTSLGLFDLGLFPSDVVGGTDAEVAFTPPGATEPQNTCADAAATGSDFDWPVSAGHFSVSLVSDPSVIETRCAGPLISDLSGELPALSVPVESILDGERSVDLSGGGPFTAGGFTGTVSSTIVYTLGHPDRSNLIGKLSLGSRTGRGVEVEYRVRLGGTLSDTIDGDSSAAMCGPLGSCGLAGTLTETPSPVADQTVLVASGSSKRPLGDYRAALGLGSGDAKGIESYGIAAWTDGGTVTEATEQDGAACDDSAPAGPSQLELTVDHARLSVSYATGSGEQPSGLRTRCPGPFGSGGSGISPDQLATGSVPVSALRRRTVTLVLTHPTGFTDDGYTGSQSPALTVTLTREHVTAFGPGPPPVSTGTSSIAGGGVSSVLFAASARAGRSS